MNIQQPESTSQGNNIAGGHFTDHAARVPTTYSLRGGMCMGNLGAAASTRARIELFVLHTKNAPGGHVHSFTF